MSIVPTKLLLLLEVTDTVIEKILELSPKEKAKLYTGL